jgi:hypothetical protein
VRQPPNRYHPKNRLPPVAVWLNRDPFLEYAFVDKNPDIAAFSSDNIPEINEYEFAYNEPISKSDYLGGCTCGFFPPDVAVDLRGLSIAKTVYYCTMVNQGYTISVYSAPGTCNGNCLEMFFGRDCNKQTCIAKINYVCTIGTNRRKGKPSWHFQNYSILTPCH